MELSWTSSSLTKTRTALLMADLSLEAEIHLLSTAEGGRRGVIRSGYRPSLWFGETSPRGEPELHSVLVQLHEREELLPGQRSSASIFPLAYETWPQVRPGMRFDLFDGGRSIGTGALRSTPAPSIAEPELRRALNSALEEWVIERFGDRVVRRPRLGEPLEPDLIAHFDDDEGHRHVLIAEVIAKKPRTRDVERLVRMMARHDALLGVIVALDDPSAVILDAIYQHGTVALLGDLRAPKIRVVTTRDLARGYIALLPTTQLPQEIALLAA